jgi:hypothetical protein
MDRCGRLFTLVCVILSLVACADKQSPVEVVESFMTAVEAFDLDTAASLVCAAQQDKVRKGLEPFYEVTRPGEAFDLSFHELSFEERSNDGEMAVVHVGGLLRLSFLGQEDIQEVNEEHIVVRENGRWVICDP